MEFIEDQKVSITIKPEGIYVNGLRLMTNGIMVELYSGRTLPLTELISGYRLSKVLQYGEEG